MPELDSMSETYFALPAALEILQQLVTFEAIEDRKGFNGALHWLVEQAQNGFLEIQHDIGVCREIVREEQSRTALV